MLYTLSKILISAGLIALISELARRNSLIAAVLASVPLVSLLAFVWLYLETREVERIAALSGQIFWLVLPSLVLFLVLPGLLRAGLNFWLSLSLAVLATAACYGLMLLVLRHFHVQF